MHSKNHPINPTKRPPAMFAVFFKVLTELIHQRKQAMLWFPVFLGIGIAIYFSLQTEPHLPILITLLIIGLTLVAIACLWAHPIRWLFVLCAWVILGVLVSSLRTNLVSAPILGWRYYGTMTGTVIGIDRSSKDRIRLTLTDLSIGKISAPRTPKKIRISLYGKNRNIRRQAGRYRPHRGLYQPAIRPHRARWIQLSTPRMVQPTWGGRLYPQKRGGHWRGRGFLSDKDGFMKNACLYRG